MAAKYFGKPGFPYYLKVEPGGFGMINTGAWLHFLSALHNV